MILEIEILQKIKITKLNGKSQALFIVKIGIEKRMEELAGLKHFWTSILLATFDILEKNYVDANILVCDFRLPRTGFTTDSLIIRVLTSSNLLFSGEISFANRAFLHGKNDRV